MKTLVLLISRLSFLCIPFYTQAIAASFTPLDVVYHGSTNANIKVLEPHSNNIRDKNEGPVIFATPSLRLASCYLFRWDDSWVHQSILWKYDNKSDYQVIMVILDKIRFNRQNNGGSIYILPAQGFTFDEYKGLGIYEWINKGSVTPILKIDFSSALVAMEKLGVKVYFIKQKQFQHYISLQGDEREQFLSSLSAENRP